MTLAIETHQLTRQFGGHLAVDGVNLRVSSRKIYGFLGRNGAGKTTTIRMILSLIRPTHGHVTVFGEDVFTDRLKIAAQIGAMVETPALYDRLTGRENLEIARRLRRAPSTDIDRVLELADLRFAADRLAGGYSQGMRQRLSIARALVGAPKLLILDEPANGLDPDGIRDLRVFLRGLPSASGATVFVSSHLLAEIESIADDVGLMNDGRLLVQSPLSELKAAHATEVALGVLEPARALSFFRNKRVQARQDDQGDVHVQLSVEDRQPESLAALIRCLLENDIEVFRVSAGMPSLEAIYMKLVGTQSDANKRVSSERAVV